MSHSRPQFRSAEPGRVEIRVIGQPGDVTEVTRLLRQTAGLEVTGQSGQRRADSRGAVRVYVDGRLPGEGRVAGATS